MRYHNITKDDMLNGEGIRVVLWVAGCSHECKGCQNPVTWDKDNGLIFDQPAKNEIFEELQKDYVSGITFSGGDPLMPYHLDEITEFCKEIKEKFPNKTIWVYTGYTWKTVESFPIISYIDVLVDGPFVQEMADANLHWRGSANQMVIDVKKTKELGQAVLVEGII